LSFFGAEYGVSSKSIGKRRESDPKVAALMFALTLLLPESADEYLSSWVWKKKNSGNT
jgi:hypothetical protein